MEKVRKCYICGKMFVTESKGYYCSDSCRNVAKLQREKKYRTKKVLQEETIKRQENDLVKLNEEARAAGMTYGKYMAQKYAKKHPITRIW